MDPHCFYTYQGRFGCQNFCRKIYSLATLTLRIICFHFRVIAVHPGNMVSSSLGRNWWIYRLIFTAVRPFAKSLQQAASPAVFAAAAPEMATASGIYVNNCFPCQPSDPALDEHLRKKLWNVSTQMILEKVSANCAGIKSLYDI